jgi:hypothetical protein
MKLRELRPPIALLMTVTFLLKKYPSSWPQPFNGFVASYVEAVESPMTMMRKAVAWTAAQVIAASSDTIPVRGKTLRAKIFSQSGHCSCNKLSQAVSYCPL